MKEYKIHRGKRCLNFCVTGSGIPILIVGFGSYTYRLFSKDFKSRYKFILHDYYGLTHKGTDFDLSIENILDDINSIQNHLEIEKINILGHSSSGTVALDYTLNHINSVNKLFMVCSPIIYDSSYYKIQQENQRENLIGDRKHVFDKKLSAFQKRKEANLVDDFFKEFHAVQTPLYFYDFNYTPLDYWEGISVNPEFINTFMDRTYNVYKRKGNIMSIADKLVSIAGKWDFATPLKSWEPFLDVLNVNVFEYSGHYPMLEEARKFDDLIIPILDSV